MPAAARIGDTTSHGGTVTGPGEATVLIGKKPAAVFMDTHVCPIVTNPPHPSSTPFTVGSATVFIGKKPALRVNAVCACGAQIVTGEFTVNIGG
jgi:uncharacterized Zn-binding protein involved in type VI secretion